MAPSEAAAAMLLWGAVATESTYPPVIRWTSVDHGDTTGKAEAHPGRHTMSLTDDLKQAATRLAGDPRILRLLQSEQTLKLLTLLVEMPERFGALSATQGARFARNFHLATADDVEDLKRRVADLEAEVAQLKMRVGQ